MNLQIKSYIEKNIPFALFRAPGQPVRFVAQKTPLDFSLDFQTAGFHFTPFSTREKVPHIVIQNDVDMLLENNQFPKEIDCPAMHLQNGISFREHEVDFSTYQKHLKSYFSFFEKHNVGKAIYSRLKKIDLQEDFELGVFFEKIKDAYSNAFVYLVHLPDLGLWAGASPERLLEYQNGNGKTVALAGTQKLAMHQQIDDLVWGKKEIAEHQMVADYILEKIKNNDAHLLKSNSPYTSAAGAMAHLKQDFEFEISKKSLAKFLNELHPTPAVCGLPKERAMDLIYEIEPYDRQYYAGYLGMVEANADVNFYVNLRCMKIYNNSATLFVGGGITAASDPSKEWQETELKAKTLLNILELTTVE